MLSRSLILVLAFFGNKIRYKPASAPGLKRVGGCPWIVRSVSVDPPAVKGKE
ncbi:hypothetical protein [Methanogenium cariaci]|uniref:hypothetical protein n=1 Tax=Methanogenium cariaci TaxID=2197 RepID=UPI0012F68E91|nr:hypothetical protein [Methanogenium cariaci]